MRKSHQMPATSNWQKAGDAQNDLNSWMFCLFFFILKMQKAAKKLNGSCCLGAVGIDAQMVSPAACLAREGCVGFQMKFSVSELRGRH